MLAQATIYPVRNALTSILASLITTQGLPAINAGFAANSLSQNWPALTANDVIIGDMYAVGSNAITVRNVHATYDPDGNRNVMINFVSEIGIKCVAIGNSLPAEYELFGTTIIDNLADLLSSLTNYNCQPVQLPSGSVITDMRVLEIYPLPAPMKSIEGTVRVPAWKIIHHAATNYYLDRPNPVGG